MPDLQFDHYYRYSELEETLQSFASQYPHLLQLSVLGKSYEGRAIYLATITHFATGPAEEKPALWIDGNIHATELAPCTTCLLYIQTLLEGFGQDEAITRCLERSVVYVCPRVNPDGAEWALEEHPRLIRSSTRPYPYDEEPLRGLFEEDIDLDGRILSMRIPDPNGSWKAHPDEPRLLIPRDPAESGGKYYRVLPEGRLENYDGITIQVPPNPQGLDLNRNFPFEWRQEHIERGAGPFPASEPEVRALVDFVSRHKNISLAVTFHTFGGLLLRPYSTHPDEDMAAEDLWTYQKIGKKGSELTGYPNVSVYHDFRYHPKEVTTGAFDDWLFDHLGVYSWTTEIWAPLRQAGIKDYKPIDWWREHPLEEDLKLLKWNDEVLAGKGYVDWYEFDHPQLGKVELGGWDLMYAFRNPPPAFLEAEIRPFPQWLLWQQQILPRLELLDASVTPLSEGTSLVRLVLCNNGWLPSYGSKRALDKKIVRGVICEIHLPAGAALVTGLEKQEFGQLEGRSFKGAFFSYSEDETSERLKVEWVVRARQGGRVQLIARHDRAGVVCVNLDLPA